MVIRTNNPRESRDKFVYEIYKFITGIPFIIMSTLFLIKPKLFTFAYKIATKIDVFLKINTNLS